MKDGFCSKCGSNEVFVDNGRTEQTYRLGAVFITDYFCLTCGYAESYISEKDRTKAMTLLRQEQESAKYKKRKNDEL